MDKTEEVERVRIAVHYVCGHHLVGSIPAGQVKVTAGDIRNCKSCRVDRKVKAVVLVGPSGHGSPA